MHRNVLFGVLMLLVFVWTARAGAQSQARRKEVVIISSGSNTPDTVYLSRNAQALERARASVQA